MWPLILVNFAMAKEFRTTLGPLMLYCIVPGKPGGGEPSLEPYLELAVDDLLSVDDMMVYHALEKAPLMVKIRLLYYLCDIPAFAKIMNTVGQGGISACTYCFHKGEYCNSLDKCIHLGHRRFLPKNHPFRNDGMNYADGQEPRDQPKRITPEEELDMRRNYEKAKTKSAKKEQAKASGYKTQPALSKVKGFNRSKQMSPDIMHTVADVCSTTIKLVNGTTDTVKVRKTEEFFNRYQIKSNYCSA